MKNNLLKFISTVLVLSICLTILPSFPALAQESFAQTTVSPDTLEIALQMLETPRLPEEDKPEAVASYLVEQKGHVVRLREKEEDLNTVIFQNRDGNKTMYHFDQPVKYVDKNGNIKDKKTTVTDVIDKAEYSADYGFVTSDNDVNTYFPKRLGGNAGVLVEYQDIKIEIIPLSAEKNAAVPARKKQYQVDSETRDSIEYNKAFGNNTLLKYTPTFSGFKEDIILTAYTGRNEFGFKVKTNGLSLVCEDGKYYLADPATEEKLMQVGNIIVYDSSMVPNTTPSETVLNPVKPQPVELTEEERNALYFPEGPLDPVYNHYYRLQSVKENEEYILTIVVDEDYLTCEDTVYPVTVDPSLSLTASGFEDATIYTNYTSNQGASLNMFAGNYTERYGGTKGVARALVKFPGLFSNSTFASLSSNNIISVDFMLRDTMCEGDAVWIDCYRMNQNWSESTAVYSTALWNGYTGTHVDNAYIHYYGGTGSNGTGTGHWYHLDITAVVKEWMNGYYGGRNNHYGIMLKASDETQAAKTFATSDNTSYPPKLIVDYDDGDHGSVAVTSVRFVQDEYVVPVGWSGRIAVTVEPAGASDEFLNWVLFDSAGVSTINYTTGIFTAFAEGTVTLAAGPLSGSTPNSGDVCTIRIVSEVEETTSLLDVFEENDAEIEAYLEELEQLLDAFLQTTMPPKYCGNVEITAENKDSTDCEGENIYLFLYNWYSEHIWPYEKELDAWKNSALENPERTKRAALQEWSRVVYGETAWEQFATGLNNISTVLYYELADIGNTLQSAINQIVLGEFSGEVTVVGTAGQVALSFSGIDIVTDIRDISYDLSHWEWSWDHAGQTAVDLVAFLPFIGALKNIDEIKMASNAVDSLSDLARNADELAAIERKVEDFVDLAKQSGKLDEIAQETDFWVKVATNNNSSDIVMLGKYYKNADGTEAINSYSAIAKANGYAYYSMPQSIWENLKSTLGEDIFEINKRYLDKQASKGKTIYFSVPPFGETATGDFLNEINYLRDTLGYTISSGTNSAGFYYATKG